MVRSQIVYNAVVNDPVFTFWLRRMVESQFSGLTPNTSRKEFPDHWTDGSYVTVNIFSRAMQSNYVPISQDVANDEARLIAEAVKNVSKHNDTDDLRSGVWWNFLVRRWFRVEGGYWRKLDYLHGQTFREFIHTAVDRISASFVVQVLQLYKG